MNCPADRIEVQGKNYYVRNKRHFQAYNQMLMEDKEASFEFAFGMSYGKKGAHRDSRSGGTMHRTLGQIFINTFQGKMAEFAVYRYLIKHLIPVEKPDMEKYELGKWDSFDLECQGKRISVKSTKSYGDLLLLETKDWDKDGQYIPNLSEGKSVYDYTILVRFNPDGEQLMKQHNLLFQKECEIPADIQEILWEKVSGRNWSYDFPGFIYQSELVQMIQEQRIIPKGAMLNGKTKMDAENYYFQTGNMHPMWEIYMRDVNEKMDEREALRLKRKCPKCGNDLVMRKGHIWFWGCKGFASALRCEYRETLDHRRF